MDVVARRAEEGDAGTAAIPALSVVVPAFADIASLRHLLQDLLAQDISHDAYEIVIVDDGSPQPIAPALENGRAESLVAIRCERKANGGGPAARNYGAAIARAEILMFIDQDMRVPPKFIRAHLEAQRSVPEAAICALFEYRLTVSEDVPFARWYAKTAKWWQTEPRRAAGPGVANVAEVDPILLTSTNLSIPRRVFQAVGGFPIYEHSGVEDMALGLVLQRRGVPVMQIHGVEALHVETKTALPRFCERMRTGMAGTVMLIRQFPDVFGELERTEQHRVNGPVRLGQDAWSVVLRKIVKSLVMLSGTRRLAYGVVGVLERIVPNSTILSRAYDLMVGAHLQAGWRQGLASKGLSGGV